MRIIVVGGGEGGGEISCSGGASLTGESAVKSIKSSSPGLLPRPESRLACRFQVYCRVGIDYNVPALTIFLVVTLQMQLVIHSLPTIEVLPTPLQMKLEIWLLSLT